MKTLLVAPRASSISDPFHFYLGYFLPAILKVKINNSRIVLFPKSDLYSLQAWLNFHFGNLNYEAIDKNILSEFLRRKQLLVKVRGRDKVIILPDWDYVAKLGNPLRQINIYRTTKVIKCQIEKTHPSDNEIDYNKTVVLISRTTPTPNKNNAIFERTIENEQDFVRTLRCLGFIVNVVDPAILSPQDIVKQINRSKIMVGQFGAGLFHASWLARGACLLEISSEGHNPFFLKPTNGYL